MRADANRLFFFCGAVCPTPRKFAPAQKCRLKPKNCQILPFSAIRQKFTRLINQKRFFGCFLAIIDEIIIVFKEYPLIL